MDSSDDALPGHDLNHSNDTMTPFGYIPHFGINVTFVVAYSLLCAASLIQFLHCCWHKRHRRWLPRSFFMMAGIAVEMAGFVERVRIAKNSKGYRDFVLQVSLLNLAPAFVTAA